MKSKPIIFNILGLFFSAIAFSLPLQVAVLYEHEINSFYEWHSVLMKLTPLNWAVIAITLLNGLLCFKAKPVIKYTIPLSILLVAVNNFFVGSWGVDFSFLTTWIATVTYAVLSYSYAYTQGLEVIDHPEKQWWKIPQRFQKTYPIWLEWEGQKKLLAKTFDISKTGTFISALAGNNKFIPQDLQLGGSLKVLIGTKDGDIQLHATIVRKEDQSRGNYPAGLGLRFNGVGIKETLQLKRLLSVANQMTNV